MNKVLTTLVILIATLVTGTGVVLYGTSLFNTGNTNPSQANVPFPTFDGYRAYSIDMYDMLDNSIRNFSEKNFTAVIMQSDDGKYFRPVAVVPFYPQAQTIDITSEMNDKMYLVIYPSVRSGTVDSVENAKHNQNYILPNQIVNDNPGLVRVDSMDVMNIGFRDWVFKINPLYQTPAMNYGSTNVPEVIFTVKPVKFDNPLNFTWGSVGMDEVEGYNKNYDTKYVFPSVIELKQNSGIALAQVAFEINQTKKNLFNENKSSVILPDVGKMPLSNLTKYYRVNDTDIIYEYDYTAPISSSFGLDDGPNVQGLKGSDYLTRGVSNSTIPFRLTLNTNLSGSLNEGMTIHERIYYYDPFYAFNSYNTAPITLGVFTK